MRFAQVGSVEGDNVLAVALVQDLKFSQDLFPHRRLGIDEDDLRAGRSMPSEQACSDQLNRAQRLLTFLAIVVALFS